MRSMKLYITLRPTYFFSFFVLVVLSFFFFSFPEDFSFFFFLSDFKMLGLRLLLFLVFSCSTCTISASSNLFTHLNNIQI